MPSPVWLLVPYLLTVLGGWGLRLLNLRHLIAMGPSVPAEFTPYVETAVEDLANKERKVLRTDGMFVFVGMLPRTDLLAPYIALASGGYVETTEAMETTVPGLYAAGDIRVKRFRQITTAVADGTIAALAAQKHLRS